MDDKIKITYPSSEKVYMTGKLHPEIKVGMRKVLLTPTVTVEDGKRTVKENAPIYVYDTSGPYSDPNVKIDLKQGLPRMRESWILQRGDVEQLDGLTSEYGRMRQEDKSLDHLRFSHIQRPYRAKAGRQVSQMYYAKQGIITPEMEYVAIRENMNCRELGIDSYITPEFVRQEIAGSKALPFVAYLHRLVLEPVENGVLGHSEQVISQRTDVSDRSAVLPNFQKNIVREILGFAPALQHAAGERLHTRGISHVQFVECLAIALSEPLQNQFIRFSVHWSHG